MSDHTDMMLNRAIASADFDAYREDAKDDRIAALEAEVEAAHRAIDSIGLSRCADAHAGVYPDGRITCDDGRPPLSLVDRVEWLIRWLSDDPYPMGPRIKALEAENAALKAERDTALDNLRAADKELRGKNDLWDQKITQAYEFMQQRDAARASAAAWRKAATWWRLAARDASRSGVMQAWFKYGSWLRRQIRARRAAEAAEAQERR